MAIALGTKGNEWAWKSRPGRSIEQFKAHQGGWVIAAISIILWVRAIALLKSAL